MKKKRSILFCLALLVFSLCAAVACGGNKVELKFDTMGGEPVASVTLDVGSEYTLPIPVWTGHGFEGWYQSKDYSGAEVKTVVASENTTFYAKWSELSVITLDLGGGTLSGTEGGKLYLKAGENILSFMESYVPVREGFEFAGWYAGGEALPGSAVMPAEGITLTAHYNVGYTVETYLQTVGLDGYTRGEDLHGFAPAGENYTPSPEVYGFEVAANDHAVMTRVLSEDPAENKYTFYFDRKEFTVVLLSAYPLSAGLTEEVETSFVPYGTEFELSAERFSARGYCLTAWADNTGEIVCDSGYLESHLFGGEGAQQVKITVEGDVTLSAVWEAGYTDLFGSYDYIYIFEEEGTAYLERGGLFFEGTYNERRGTFLFHGADGSVILEGVLQESGGTYTYYDIDRAGVATLYVFGTGVVETDKVLFDEYDQIIYSKEGEDGRTTQSEGTYRLDDSGYLVAEFTTGPLAGTEMTFVDGEMSVNGVSRRLFQVRNEEEFALGDLVRFVVTEQGMNYYITTYYKLSLNGLGIAALTSEGTESYYYYLKEEDVIRLYDSNLTLVYTYKLMESGGVKGYMPYNSSLDQVFTSESGATLTLDGLCNAVYREGGNSVTGHYVTSATAFSTGSDSVRIDFISDGTDRVFIVSVHTEEIGGAIIPKYTFSEKGAGYGEFYFKNDEADVYFYYTPLIVLNETEENELTVYALDSAGNYVKYAEGSFLIDEENDLLLATLDTVYQVEVREMPIDLTEVTTFAFGVSTLSIRGSQYGVAYLYSSSKGEDTTRYDTVYREENGSGTLTTVATFAVYQTEEGSFMGIVSMDGNVMIVTTSYQGEVLSLYFEIHEESGTFVRLTQVYGSMTALLADGTDDPNQTLKFDGKGGVVYSVTEGEEVTSYTGTFVSTGDSTYTGASIYEFRADGMNFRFIVVSSSESVYFARYNENCNGRYTSGSDTLELDGFAFMATYTVGQVSIEGVYSLMEEKVVRFFDRTTGDILWFDLKEDYTFTVRGTEYGTYLLYDNHNFTGTFLHFDGYGKLTAFLYEEGEGDDAEPERVELGTGTYRLRSDGAYDLSYEGQNGTWSGIGGLGTVAFSSEEVYNAVFLSHEETFNSFVDESDRSVLVMDGFGNAIRFDKMGQAESGAYLLITDSLLYYANDAGTNACIYEFDAEKGTANAVQFDRFSYYTQDLESLMFTEYGFMIMGGETRYYYDLVDGEILVYHSAQEGETGNAYGFVEENFGAPAGEKTWKGKTYYLNSGYALMFRRAEETKNNYPVSTRGSDGTTAKYPLEDLTFTPSGSAEFSVNGSVTLNGQNFRCVVTREVTEEGETVMYVTVQNFRFDINVYYRGEQEDGSSENTYEVTAMKYELLLPSWMYMYLYYILVPYGFPVSNTYGLITLNETYDESGEVVEGSNLATAEFGGSSGVEDTKGELISVKDVPYTESENGLYCIEFTGEDGYLYHIYFQTSSDFVGVLGYYAYRLYAFTRVETLTAGENGEYDLEIERVIVTESSALRAGGYFSVKLYRDETLIEAERAFVHENTLYYVVKGESENALTYYIFTLVEDIPEDLGDEEESEGGREIYVFLSASLTVKAAQRYGTDENNFADFDAETDQALAVMFAGNLYVAETTEGPDGSGAYTVTTASGIKFYVNKNGMIALITEGEPEGEA